ncbi:MAG: hypothetical protein KJ939_07540 [Nanoarchaeota archaeon]|nr:hypothetical protein [Nanoarchaeota archaeon]
MNLGKRISEKIPIKLPQLFGQTLRDAPADASASLSAGAEVVSHQLLMRAGFIRPLRAGSV